MTPKMSATESAALKAGTIGFEGKIFGGDASLAYLKKSYSLPELSEEEVSERDIDLGGSKCCTGSNV